jgi:hypothetical protein
MITTRRNPRAESASLALLLFFAGGKCSTHGASPQGLGCQHQRVSVPVAGRTMMFLPAKSTFRERSLRAAPGTEPGIYRALRENHTTKPSSQMSITATAALSRATLPAQTFVPCNTYSRTRTTARGSNPCGQSPLVFESLSLTTPTLCLAVIMGR